MSTRGTLAEPVANEEQSTPSPRDVVLEARERRRGDRLIGLARWQHGRMHAGMSYDLELDTSQATPAECAKLIKNRFGL